MVDTFYWREKGKERGDDFVCSICLFQEAYVFDQSLRGLNVKRMFLTIEHFLAWLQNLLKSKIALAKSLIVMIYHVH